MPPRGTGPFSLIPVLGFCLGLSLLVAGCASTAPETVNGQPKVVKIGLSLPLTGADADSADAILKGAQMAIEEVNARGDPGGYKLEAVIYDSATPAAGHYDPAQAATNYRRFVADRTVVASVGPVMSGEGKAISRILSEADMATITPSSTNPDITDPRFKDQYRPRSKPIYFRTVTTDAYQGPNMANYMFRTLNVKTVYIVDDGGAFGVGIADTFQRRASELGMRVLGRDRLDPKGSDYKAILTRIQGLNPDAVYYGGVLQALTTLARQAHELMPRVIKAGSDGVYDLSFPQQVGKRAAEGWYATNAAPDVLSDPEARQWVSKFRSRYNRGPTNYSMTAYNAVTVVADAIDRTVKAGKLVTRSNVRDMIQTTKLDTIQGPIEFDENGDIKTRTIAIYQVRDGSFHYLGVAPEN